MTWRVVSDTIGSGSKNIWSGSENIGTAGHPSGGFLAHLVTRHTNSNPNIPNLETTLPNCKQPYTKLQGEHEEKSRELNAWSTAYQASPGQRQEGAFIFEKENKHVYRAAKLYTEYHKLTDLEDMEVIDIALMVMRAVVSGCLRPTHWLWEFIASQLQFFTVKDYRGRRCSIFSSRVAEFWFELRPALAVGLTSFSSAKDGQELGAVGRGSHANKTETWFSHHSVLSRSFEQMKVSDCATWPAALGLMKPITESRLFNVEAKDG
ncbi:uncharacterized protein EV422DRAFT_570225 [Fimicolochytrium jonesii]|uniref:uncharacterized protein n=1 Tax=Fimicolochytrium jonesii TaxID=1396493 RepID=UPI0022FEF9CE|nr:uncharacterized protein EV422DRAFT_570225 [Fimicolochytrium jonesii]KAI8818077.1 hypothetical protein EV422DRAFT_570225 [Fimicolochytrium jonesii]